MKVKGILTVYPPDTLNEDEDKRRSARFWCLNTDAEAEQKRFGDAGYMTKWEPVLTYIPDQHPVQETDYERT